MISRLQEKVILSQFGDNKIVVLLVPGKTGKTTERGGQLFVFEFTWNPKAKAAISKTFTNNYPGTIGKIITPDNIEEFITSSSAKSSSAKN